jgi:hypothetical protein
MGVLYDYFRAPDDAVVCRHMDDHEAASPLSGDFEGIDLKGIDPSVVLGQLVGFASGRPHPVRDRLVWPAGGEPDPGHEGPWVTALPDLTRDVLADIRPDRIPELAERWSRIEEFGGYADVGSLREDIQEIAALAGKARQQGESLYCWICL